MLFDDGSAVRARSPVVKVTPRDLALVATGGAAGGLSRHVLALEISMQWVWLFAVNGLGCFLIGWLYTAIPASARARRLLLGPGFLGGFTTLSAVSLTPQTGERLGGFAELVLPLLVMPLACCLAAWLGRRAATGVAS